MIWVSKVLLIIVFIRKIVPYIRFVLIQFFAKADVPLAKRLVATRYVRALFLIPVNVS